MGQGFWIVLGYHAQFHHNCPIDDGNQAIDVIKVSVIQVMSHYGCICRILQPRSIYRFRKLAPRIRFVSSRRCTGSNPRCSCPRACRACRGTGQASCGRRTVLSLGNIKGTINLVIKYWAEAYLKPILYLGNLAMKKIDLRMGLLKNWLHFL